MRDPRASFSGQSAETVALDGFGGDSGGASCGVRFGLADRAALGVTRGTTKRGPRTADTMEVRGPCEHSEEAQPVPGPTNGLAPSLGPKPKGLATARARWPVNIKPDYASLGAKGVGSGRTRLA